MNALVPRAYTHKHNALASVAAASSSSSSLSNRARACDRRGRRCHSSTDCKFTFFVCTLRVAALAQRSAVRSSPRLMCLCVLRVSRINIDEMRTTRVGATWGSRGDITLVQTQSNICAPSGLYTTGINVHSLVYVVKEESRIFMEQPWKSNVSLTYFVQQYVYHKELK